MVRGGPDIVANEAAPANDLTDNKEAGDFSTDNRLLEHVAHRQVGHLQSSASVSGWTGWLAREHARI